MEDIYTNDNPPAKEISFNPDWVYVSLYNKKLKESCYINIPDTVLYDQGKSISICISISIFIFIFIPVSASAYNYILHLYTTSIYHYIL